MRHSRNQEAHALQEWEHVTQSPQAVTGKVINYYATTNGLSMLELNSGGSINADVVWNGNASIAANIIIGENCSVRTGWWQKLEMLDCSN